MHKTTTYTAHCNLKNAPLASSSVHARCDWCAGCRTRRYMLDLYRMSVWMCVCFVVVFYLIYRGRGAKSSSSSLFPFGRLMAYAWCPTHTQYTHQEKEHKQAKTYQPVCVSVPSLSPSAVLVVRHHQCDSSDSLLLAAAAAAAATRFGSLFKPNKALGNIITNSRNRRVLYSIRTLPSRNRIDICSVYIYVVGYMFRIEMFAFT